MKNFTRNVLVFVFSLSFLICFSQERRMNNARQQFNNSYLTPENPRSAEQNNIVQCYTVEYENSLRERFPERATTEEFENWIAPKIEEIKTQRLLNPDDTDVVKTIPVIFHIITDGTGSENLAVSAIQAQLDQLNIDYANLAGSGYAVAADTEIQFCLAEQEPFGSPLNESGINRVTTFGDDTFLNTFVNSDIKPATQWDPTRYMNIWVVGGLTNGTFDLLGYAQFPDSSGLNGLNPSGGAANTDGVVVIASSVGSIANPNPNGGAVGAGRTLTHEVGHWLGLRHIWGDTAACTDDDFCPDTPDAANENYGCPTGADSCSSFPPVPDMIENYMDYTDDSCMHTFTADQKLRIDAVMANSPRRVELATSAVCTVPTIPFINFGAISPGQIMEGNDCNYQDITIDLISTLPGSEDATATLVAAGSATENADFELISNSVTFNSGSTTASNSITLRVFEDGFVETDETISLSVNVSTTGDTVATASTYNVNILDDDEHITETSTVTIFSDDFSDGDASDWTIFDNDGEPLDDWSVVQESNWDPAFGIYTDYFMASYSWNGDPYTPDNFLVSPMIAIPAGATSINLRYFAGSGADPDFYSENYEVYISNTAATVANVLAGTRLVDTVIPFVGGQYYDVDISAFAGQNVYISFRHHDTVDEWLLGIDDVSVSTSGQTAVQTMVNTGSPDELNLLESGIAYATDPASGGLMLDVNNTGGFDFGCTTVSVSRDATTAGGDAVMYNSALVSDYVLAKTFDISTANANTTDSSTINFYFTEAEVAAWETFTGNGRSSLYVIKEGTNEVVSTSSSVFGSEVKISASFTTGLTGTYVFGIQTTLSVNNLELNNVLSIYPNPVNDRLTIKLSNNNLPDGYKIYNMLGQVITENTLFNESDLEINASALSNGMYFIKVHKDNSVVTFPFIKN